MDFLTKFKCGCFSFHRSYSPDRASLSTANGFADDVGCRRMERFAAGHNNCVDAVRSDQRRKG
jgi:hypothetical protein